MGGRIAQAASRDPIQRGAWRTVHWAFKSEPTAGADACDARPRRTTDTAAQRAVIAVLRSRWPKVRIIGEEEWEGEGVEEGDAAFASPRGIAMTPSVSSPARPWVGWDGGMLNSGGRMEAVGGGGKGIIG